MQAIPLIFLAIIDQYNTDHQIQEEERKRLQNADPRGRETEDEKRKLEHKRLKIFEKQ
jgi:hypothetical protein